jgi:hypothetical protein
MHACRADAHASPRCHAHSQVIAELHRYGLRQLSAAMNEGDKQISRICLALKLVILMVGNIHENMNHAGGTHTGSGAHQSGGTAMTAESRATGGQDQGEKAEGDLNPPTPTPPHSQQEIRPGEHLQAQTPCISAAQLGAILTVGPPTGEKSSTCKEKSLNTVK